MPKSKRRSRSAAQIRKILVDLSESGLSQREFAFSRHIPLSTLCSWLRKHRPAIAQAPAQSPEVIPVGTFFEPAPVLEIEFPGGEILRLGAGVRGEDLRTALAELRRC